MKALDDGYTLVEIIIVVAMVAIISAIAIPAYKGFGREARLNAARQNMEPLRLALEDYFLDNGKYGSAATRNTSQINSTFGWAPSGDQGKYSYQAKSYNSAGGTSTYDLLVTHDQSGDWVLCQDRFGECCDSTMSGATTSSCP